MPLPSSVTRTRGDSASHDARARNDALPAGVDASSESGAENISTESDGAVSVSEVEEEGEEGEEVVVVVVVKVVGGGWLR